MLFLCTCVNFFKVGHLEIFYIFCTVLPNDEFIKIKKSKLVAPNFYKIILLLDGGTIPNYICLLIQYKAILLNILHFHPTQTI